MEQVFWITAFFASLLGTIAGFGISTILLPVAVQTYSYSNALAITSIFHIFGNLGRIKLATGKINKKIVVQLGIPAVFATILGAYSIQIIDNRIGKIILGVILTTYAILSFLGIEPRIEPSYTSTLIGGLVYGYLSGFVGTGGPLRGALLLGLGLDKEEYIATSGAISLLIDLTRVPAYLVSGYLNYQYYTMIPFLLVVALVGSSSSKFIVDIIKPEDFRKIIQIVIRTGRRYSSPPWN